MYDKRTLLEEYWMQSVLYYLRLTNGKLNEKLKKFYVEKWIGETCLVFELGPSSKIISCNENARGY